MTRQEFTPCLFTSTVGSFASAMGVAHRPRASYDLPCSTSAGHSARHAPCELSLRPAVRSRDGAKRMTLLAIVPIVCQRQRPAMETVRATAEISQRPMLHNYRAPARSTCITVRLCTRRRVSRYLIALVDALFGPCRPRTPAPAPAETAHRNAILRNSVPVLLTR